MTQSLRERDPTELVPEQARWADAVGPGDLFDATSGWMRCHIADLCSRRPATFHPQEEAPPFDLIGGLFRRLLGRPRNG